MTPDERLADRIRSRRRELGFTEEELAEKLHDSGWTGATYQLVQKVELYGRRLKVVEKRLFARALEVDPARLEEGLGIHGEPVTIQGVRAIAHARGVTGTLAP